MAIPVIYEDDHFIVINKNAGLLSIPDRFDALKENAYDLLSKHYESLYTVHRIDKDTSGLMQTHIKSLMMLSNNTKFKKHI